jgi:hypothetical protein
MKFYRFVTTFLIVGVFAISAFGEDRALFVGLDKYKSVSDTPGGVADAREMAKFMQRKYRFPERSIKILTDEMATADNIRLAIQTWLIDGTQPGDRVFFLYSGHGGQIDDDNGDERDELDEVLAPYDVFIGSTDEEPQNVIRDDEINVFLLKLSGRRVVIAIDSCHSGTISRSVEKQSKYLALKNKFNKMEVTRSLSDRESYVPKDDKYKDLSVVKEDFIDGRLNGITIFSAAAAYQKAMWLADKSRGAFAYAFEMVQKNDCDYPTVAELDRRIRDYIEYLKKNKLVETTQIPEMEIISQTRIDDKPLFAEVPQTVYATPEWETPVLVSVHNPMAEFKVKLNLSGSSFKVGDKLKYSVDIKGLGATEKAYLYILVFSKSPKDGTKYVTSLFPSPSAGNIDNNLGNGRHEFPRVGKSGDTYVTEAMEPGKDVFVAFVSRKKLNFGDRDEYTWEDAYRRIGIGKLPEQVEQLTRSWGNRPKLQGGDWQAASAVIYVK